MLWYYYTTNYLPKATFANACSTPHSRIGFTTMLHVQHGCIQPPANSGFAHPQQVADGLLGIAQGQPAWESLPANRACNHFYH